MRWLLILLLLANIAFAAFVHWGRVDQQGDAQLVNLQMNAAQVRIIGGGQDQPAPAPASPVAATGACLAWGPFEAAEAKRAREVLDAMVPPERIETRELPGDTAYWVHMPVQKSRAEAVKKLGELKALGIAAATIVDNDTAWTNAIDLGQFPQEAAAREHLAKLQASGVRTAQITTRQSGGGVQWLVREPSAAVTARVLEVKQKDFADSTLGAVPCPELAARPRG
jgi:hypothetical protein